MGRRGRPSKKKREEHEEEEVSESAYIPPASIRRKLHRPSPPGSKNTTQQTRAGLRSETRNLKESLSASSHSTQENSLSAKNVSQSTTPLANFPAMYLLQTQEPVTKAFVAKCGTARTPLRAAVWNVKSVPCASSASTPEKNIPAKNLPEIPSPDCLQTDKEPSTEPAASMPRHQEENPPSPASSFNCTEIVAMLGNDYLDLDEVASKAYPALVTVDGYRVKEEFAPLVRSIIAKYGDIGKECSFKSLEIRSSLLEKVCKIFNDLEATETLLVTPVELKLWLEVVEDLESMRIDVKWLHKRLYEINDAIQLSKGYLSLKDALATNLTAVARKKKEFDELEEERAKISEALLGTRAKIKLLFRKSLVDGLL